MRNCTYHAKYPRKCIKMREHLSNCVVTPTHITYWQAKQVKKACILYMFTHNLVISLKASQYRLLLNRITLSHCIEWTGFLLQPLSKQIIVLETINDRWAVILFQHHLQHYPAYEYNTHTYARVYTYTCTHAQVTEVIRSLIIRLTRSEQVLVSFVYYDQMICL